MTHVHTSASNAATLCTSDTIGVQTHTQACTCDAHLCSAPASCQLPYMRVSLPAGTARRARGPDSARLPTGMALERARPDQRLQHAAQYHRRRERERQCRPGDGQVRGPVRGGQCVLPNVSGACVRRQGASGRARCVQPHYLCALAARTSSSQRCGALRQGSAAGAARASAPESGAQLAWCAVSERRLCSVQMRLW